MSWFLRVAVAALGLAGAGVTYYVWRTRPAKKVHK